MTRFLHRHWLFIIVIFTSLSMLSNVAQAFGGYLWGQNNQRLMQSFVNQQTDGKIAGNVKGIQDVRAEVNVLKKDIKDLSNQLYRLNTNLEVLNTRMEPLR